MGRWSSTQRNLAPATAKTFATINKKLQEDPHKVFELVTELSFRELNAVLDEDTNLLSVDPEVRILNRLWLVDDIKSIDFDNETALIYVKGPVRHDRKNPITPLKNALSNPPLPVKVRIGEDEYNEDGDCLTNPGDKGENNE